MSSDLFLASQRLLRVSVLGREMQMPEHDSVLRGFQYAAPEMTAFSRFCWNGDCRKCIVTVRDGGGESTVQACRLDVCEGMRVTSVSEEIQRLL
jgi:predicted molibdopterin-dependent oxidoreductase YjgC